MELSAKQLVLQPGRFFGLFWTQFLGAMNDNVFKNALVLLIAYKDIELFGLPKESLVAIAGALFILPYILFSGYAGQWSDYRQKSKVAQATKLLEIVIMALAVLCFFIDEYIGLILLLFLMGTQSTLFSPVKYSIIPNLVNSKTLVKANALVEFGTFFAILIGTILGGIIVGLDSYRWGLALTLLTVAALGYFTSRQIPEVPIVNQTSNTSWNPMSSYKSMFRESWSQPIIFRYIMLACWFWFIGAGMLSYLPILCKDIIVANENVVTLFLTSFTVGIGLGAFGCEKLSQRRIELGLIPIGLVFMSVFLISMYLFVETFLQARGESAELLTMTQYLEIPGSVGLFLCFFGFSAAGGLFIVPINTLLQHRSKPSSRSQVIATNNVMNAVFMVFASILLIVLYQTLSAWSQVLAVFGGMNLLFILFLFASFPECFKQLRLWWKRNMKKTQSWENIDQLLFDQPVILHLPEAHRSHFLDLAYSMNVNITGILGDLDEEWVRHRKQQHWLQFDQIPDLETYESSETGVSIVLDSSAPLSSELTQYLVTVNVEGDQKIFGLQELPRA